ncbi:glycosyltransferase family 4 protein [Hydrogenivirga sp.]
MRVLELNTERTWRGGERQTLYNIKGFLEAGVNVELLALKGFPLAKKVSKLGVKVIEVEGSLEAYAYLCRKGKGYDILHAQTAKTQSLAVFSKPFHGRPVVYTRRVDFAPKGLIAKFKYRRTDRVVAITSAIKEILEDSLGLKSVHIITEVVEKKEINLKRAQGLKERYTGRKIVATTSALVPHKDPITMVKMIKELSSFRKDFVFLHFGEGPLLSKAKSLVNKLGISDFYKFMGFVDNVEDFFSVFDVFVMSSSEEGLGSSVLDAFIYGVPVVSTDAGGLKETVEGCGLLCPVRDYRCLAESVDKILTEQRLKEELVGKAYARAKTKHSLEKVTNDYLKLFQSLLDT